MDNLRSIITENELSLEESYVRVRKYNNYSTEGIGNILTNVGSISSDLLDRLKNISKERAYRDAVSNSARVRVKLGELTNIDLGQIVFVTPERFKGNLLSLTQELIVAYGIVVDDISEVISLLNRDIALFSNTIHEGKFDSPISYMPAKKLTSTRTKLTKSISSMFPVRKTKSISRVIDCFRSTSEISQLFSVLPTLERTLTVKKWDKLYAETMELDANVNSVIENLKDSGISIENNRAAKEITDSLYEVAKSLEFIGYIQAISLQLYSSLESLSTSLLKYKV